jgi:queuine tRNA-ribosyltransferase
MFFKLIKKASDSRARVGMISTVHGDIQTPSYVMVATRGRVRELTADEVLKAKTQILIANTFHLWREHMPEIEKAGGIHQLYGWDKMPLMTDSGGFQVFSYGFSREHDVGKIGMFPDEHARRKVLRGERKNENKVTITDKGVRFTVPNAEGKEEYAMLTPARSIEIQKKLGADIIFTFDECTSPMHDYEYTKIAMEERTHEWAKICLSAERRDYQKLYGIVQGGAYQDLREKSAKFINSLGFDGYGIGGSLGKTKEEMANVLDWSIPYLDEGKPRHLLGIGEIKDVLHGISQGIDTFDCVIPTREARHGSIWTHGGRYDVRNASERTDEPLEKGCMCEACEISTKRKISEMFKTKDMNAGRLASIHNVYFFNTLMAEARQAIYEDRFEEFKRESIAKFSRGK